MKNIFWYKIEDRSVVQPWYFGLSYYNTLRKETYLTIMPLNLIVRGIVKLYNWIKFGR